MTTANAVNKTAPLPGAFAEDWEMPKDAEGSDLLFGSAYELLRDYRRSDEKEMRFKKGTRFVMRGDGSLYAVRRLYCPEEVLGTGSEVPLGDYVPELVGNLQLARHDGASLLIAAGVVTELGAFPFDVLSLLVERGQVSLTDLEAAARTFDVLNAEDFEECWRCRGIRTQVLSEAAK